MLPNLVVIGAAKAGTTSLHTYLGDHPEIFMSETKELGFFVAGRNLSRGRAWYESQFPVALPVRGEATPAYTAHPQHQGVPERMHELLPDARLVYLVRDPVDRVVAHYRFMRRLGKERRSFEAVVRPLAESTYVARSRYAMQLERYLAVYPDDRVLVVDSSELRHDRLTTLAAIFRFLGVAEDVPIPSAALEHNPADETGLTPLGHRVRRAVATVAGEQGLKLVPRPLVHPFRSDPPVRVAPALREELAAFLAPDADRLRAITGLAFPGWSV
jgi:hypothetical protein